MRIFILCNKNSVSFGQLIFFIKSVLMKSVEMKRFLYLLVAHVVGATLDDDAFLEEEEEEEEKEEVTDKQKETSCTATLTFPVKVLQPLHVA